MCVCVCGEESYLSAEMQSVYSAAPTNWENTYMVFKQ